MSDIKPSLLKLAKQAEARNLDPVSARVAKLIREVSAASARDSQIEIESWPDFLEWWNTNRGQNLTYIFMDTYGANSEQVRMVKKLVNAADKHEKELHEFYMRLRDLTQQPGHDDQEDGPDQQGVAPPPGGGPDVDTGGDDVSDEDTTLDEIALELENE